MVDFLLPEQGMYMNFYETYNYSGWMNKNAGMHLKMSTLLTLKS